MTEQQKRVIRENSHLQSGKLARLLGLNKHQVEKQRGCVEIWSYSGVGIPFMYFDKASSCYKLQYKHKSIFLGAFNNAIIILGHLIWCIENNMFNQPRIEHPYLVNLKFGE